MTVYVFGHRNPDTDAVCSAIAYADLLQQTTYPDAVAACCGTPNSRTEFALERAGVKAPRMIMDVRPQAKRVARSEFVTARPTDDFYSVYKKLKPMSDRAVPIVEDGRVTGMLPLINLLEMVLEGDDDPIKNREVDSSLAKICEVLGGTFQHSVDENNREQLILTVGAMSAHGFETRMGKVSPERLLIVCGDRPTIQIPAIERGVRGMVVTGGYEVSPGLLQIAKANGVSIIRSPHDTATTSLRIRLARMVESAIERDFVSILENLPIEDAQQLANRTNQQVFPVVNVAGEISGILNKSDLINPPKTRIILVDHNEIRQAVRGADEADIVEVLDHHRLGGSLRSSQPIRFINEPVGSTCTLVAGLYRSRGITPTTGIALCMASGIISDTLKLRSPTTTDIDRETLAWLGTLCECDLDEYASEFFSVGSALRTCAPNEVVAEDCKEFDEKGKRFSISQIEEIGFDLFWNRKDELNQALADLSRDKRLDFSCLLVTDIVSNGSLLLMSREQGFLEEIRYPRVAENLYQLDRIVSRKKQLLPLLIRLLD
ncbi:MAG: manganese-dependent inorganic pyrophosphatase [Pirellulaceae bacterium]|jgi:manganese-dependent inorganic pyrophosphatase